MFNNDGAPFIQALTSLVNKINQAIPPSKSGKRVYSSVTGDIKPGSALTAGQGGVTTARDEKPFDTMNNIVANMMLNMTRYFTIKVLNFRKPKIFAVITLKFKQRDLSIEKV